MAASEPESSPDSQPESAPLFASHPFESDPRDHAETPLCAYEHIAPLLRATAAAAGLDASTVRLYDPYYCEGGAARALAAVGFPRVYNRNEDFYATLAARALPEFDVLVTNPPFSGTHMERLVRFALETRKPFFVLMPQYVWRKSYFLQAMRALAAAPARARPLVLGPTDAPYVFTAPARPDVAASRAVNASAPVVAGKFQCVWFVRLADCAATQAALVAQWAAVARETDCVLAVEPAALPQLQVAPRPTPAERRWRKKRRRSADEGAVESVGGQATGNAAPAPCQSARLSARGTRLGREHKRRAVAET